MDKTPFPDDFKEFLKLLISNEVEYLLVGGYAVSYHGYPRATGDIDFWIAMSAENADKVLNVLNQFGFRGANKDSLLLPEKITRMGLPPFRIELLTTISGVDFAECFAERVTDQIDGLTVNILSLKHLRANKLASGRGKDLIDLEHLPETQ